MKQLFTWSKFNITFLQSIVYSDKTAEKLKPKRLISDSDFITPYMEGICQIPDQKFVEKYRKEIEENFLAKSMNLVTICKELERNNYRGVKVRSGIPEDLLDALRKLNMTESVCRLYIRELRKAGREADVSEFESYFASPKSIDLENIIGNDLTLMDFQTEAVDRMRRHYFDESKNKAILMMPTGSGKTRTAVYFLLRYAIPRGYQVIWIAHRSMLIEQTAAVMYKHSYLIKCDDDGMNQFNMICISGEHSNIKRADTSQNAVVATIQSISRNEAYLQSLISETDKVFIVVDEAHHTLAPTYNKLIKNIFRLRPASKLLGLTATPVRGTDEATSGLLKLYDWDIINPTSMSSLIAEGVLAEPIYKFVNTGFEIEKFISLDEEKYIKKWGELSPDFIEFLAETCSRNEIIVNEYLKNRDEYGKTLIFALNAAHCISLCEAFQKKGIRCDYLYSMHDGNNEKIERFKNDDIDVLVNINILTEGSDIPNIQTVMLTRPTSSDVLLMQMIGRALRGKAFGGTADAIIVDFCDKWERFNMWLNPKIVYNRELGYKEPELHGGRTEPKLLPWEMFREIIDAFSFEIKGKVNLRTIIPCGWYDCKEYGNVLVFDDQLRGYQRLFEEREKVVSGVISSEQVEKEYFSYFCSVPTTYDLQCVLNAISAGYDIELCTFLEREIVDVKAIADSFREKGMNLYDMETAVKDNYDKQGEIIDKLYGNYQAYKNKVFLYYNLKNPIPEESTIVEVVTETKEYNPAPVYDTEELMDEVINERYPVEKNKRPHITWTDKYYDTYWGKYTYNSNSIVLNKLLNSKDVPRETVKFVIYHELLHQKLWYHDSEFRCEERKYPGYEKHSVFLYNFGRRFEFSAEM
ncbi:DEAD/DEAH box helicase [Anaerobium acetethylicum]|uniref:Superfamily II DNA or RNA helicase n=1 Tax=Anaerobium acetethylicum TaxID=1619234 RepID=A0A1D3TW02_9FIRM|nr:DEAD/DEAH box helicase [Anaerobium acetethylicum]SCP98377.1 Superfamily II DNA or RNA helicase [Anaerobium acetethylicum]